MRRVWLILILAWYVNSAEAFDLTSTRENGLGGNLLLSHPSPTELLNSSSGGAGGAGWGIETGFTRTFDLSDLDQGVAAISWRGRRIALQGGFSQLGQQDFYSERTAKLGLAYRFDSLSIGVTASYFHLSFGGVYSALSAFGVGGGVSLRRQKLILALFGDNLNRPKLYAGAMPYEPTYSAQVELRSSPTLSTLGRVLVQKMERPRFSIGQQYVLGRTGALLLGVRTSPMTYGGGVQIAIGHAELIYGASYHPTLGLAQTISISIGSRSSGGHDDSDFNR